MTHRDGKEETIVIKSAEFEMRLCLGSKKIMSSYSPMLRVGSVNASLGLIMRLAVENYNPPLGFSFPGMKSF